MIANNLITGSAAGAIVGFDRHRRVTGDLSLTPNATGYAQLTIKDNATG